MNKLVVLKGPTIANSAVSLATAAVTAETLQGREKLIAIANTARSPSVHPVLQWNTRTSTLHLAKTLLCPRHTQGHNCLE